MWPERMPQIERLTNNGKTFLTTLKYEKNKKKTNPRSILTSQNNHAWETDNIYGKNGSHLKIAIDESCHVEVILFQLGKYNTKTPVFILHYA